MDGSSHVYELLLLFRLSFCLCLTRIKFVNAGLFSLQYVKVDLLSFLLFFRTFLLWLYIWFYIFEEEKYAHKYEDWLYINMLQLSLKLF